MEGVYALTILLTLVQGSVCRPYHDPHCAPGHDVIVHLFDWTWTSIKRECVDFLGPRGFCAVQVSPAAEHAVITKPNRPWWEKYQPVSYKLISRSGNEQQFHDMVATCNSVGVRIYVDAVINHMTGHFSGVGIAGSHFDGNTCSYPGVPYTAVDCNGSDNCNTTDGDIHNYNDPIEARNCALFGLSDVRMGKEYVRQKVSGYMNKLVDMGVAGFRIDAAKHMWPGDLENVFGRLHDLPTSTVSPGSRPFVYQEVIELGPDEPIKMAEYLNTGRVTNFKFGMELANVFLHHTEPAHSLQNWKAVVGGLDSSDSVNFIYNHDTERDSMRPFQPITFREPKEAKLATAFMLAHPYGFGRVMSSFSWPRNVSQSGEDANNWMGPPHNDDMSTKEVQILANGTCADRWVCEHRWKAIYKMVEFRNVVHDTPLLNFQTPTDFQIAFSRGRRGFVVIVGDASHLDRTLNTGLPVGTYCDVISGELANGTCTGKEIHVGDDGHAQFDIDGTAEESFVAIHIDAMI